ncbi:MAG: hypothetical protein O7E57_05955 [Gammaproteobacteria bacterium]|nr:hypothetical protein [Gammaproteobacteria bacterium]
MADNPYETPGSNLDLPGRTQQRPIRGIVLGLVADLAGTTVGTVVLAFIYVLVLAGQGMNPEEVEQVMSNGETFSLFGGVSTLFGLAMSVLGGYVCIRVSNGVDLTNPIALGVITFLIAVLMAWDAYDVGEFLGLTALSFAATLWGGRTAIHRRKIAAAFEA